MIDETDGTDTSDLDGFEVEEESDAEYVECEKGQVIFPHGSAWYADTHGFNRLYVDYKTGDVKGEDNETGLMRSPERNVAKPPKSVSKVTPIGAGSK